MAMHRAYTKHWPAHLRLKLWHAAVATRERSRQPQGGGAIL